MRRILSIDGGGIRGVFPASLLAKVEESIGVPVADYFDLIAGTSTGGILALGLGLGLGAPDILRFYREHGPEIFAGNRIMKWARHFGLAKYASKPLADALQQVFGNRLLGESTKRLVIPSCNLVTGEVHVWKTAHHPRLERDYHERAVNVAISTAAAPTYFPAYRSAAGLPLIDGGVWANNPTGVAVVEAIGILGWDPNSLRVLSLGCTSSPLDVRRGQKHGLGLAYWGPKIAEVFITAQSSAAMGTALHLVGDRQNVIRISPLLPQGFKLDSVAEIGALAGLGESEARKALPELRRLFFTEVVESFEPCHRLRDDA
jgi:patatin-like phospholipase/acyl hydrolase